MKTSLKLTLTLTAVLFISSVIAVEIRADDTATAIVSVKGEVSAKAAGTDSWNAVKTGDSLSQGAQLKTGKKGEAVVKWPQGHFMKIHPLAIVSIDKLQFDNKGKNETTEISLESGKILVRANKLVSSSASFQIKTPTAVAAVRGTSFMIDTSGESGGTIALLEGSLEISIGDIEFVLDENMQLDIPADMETEPSPVELSGETAEEIRSGLQEFDSITDSSQQSSTGSSKPEDPQITTREMMHSDDFIGDYLDSNVEEFMLPGVIAAPAGIEDILVPPMPPEE